MPALERSANGALALHYAAARGCLDCVKLLVESSAELSANAQMDNDVTPVYLAAQEGHLDVLRFLVVEAGGSLYVRARDGMAPVHAAAQMGCLACLKWMIAEQGVDPNLRDGDGATPLHFAASRGHVDAVRWLLRHGARLVLDKFGKSALHDAAENQQMECLSLLLQHGASGDYIESPSKSATKDPRCVGCDVGPTSPPSSEPFYLHPPSGGGTLAAPLAGALAGALAGGPPSPPQQDGLYINPLATGPRSTSSTCSSASDSSAASTSAASSGSSSDPFYLHNPREVVYHRVRDLFDPNSAAAPPGSQTAQQKVQRASSQSGDPSPRPPSSESQSPQPPSPQPSSPQPPSPALPSGGRSPAPSPALPHASNGLTVQVEVHSCGSVSASGGTGSVISSCDESLGAAPASSPSPHAPSPALAPDAHHSEERMVAEPEYEDILYQLREEALGQPLPQSLLTVPNGPSSGGALRRDGDDEGTNGDGAVDGDGERQRRPSASHTLPPPLPPASAPNPRALKRVVSEPPPPPPPPPSGVDLRAPSPIPPLGGGDCAPMSLPAALPPSPAVTPEPVLRPSEVP